MKINFCGATQDASGYAEFSRYFVYALDKAGVEVGVEPIQVDPKNVSYGKKGNLIKKLTRKLNAEANVINMIPPLFKKYKQSGRLNIGFTMWEASKLPEIWTTLCNDMDAIFVPSTWNKEVFTNSGVTVPVYVVQPGVDLLEVPKLSEKPVEEDFKFYSIFQWTERKNPIGLIRTYLSEFKSTDKVSLTLKTYKHARATNNAALIHEEIKHIKKDLNINESLLPKINVIADLVSTEEMDKIHRTHDCFVLPHRAEGWGMPHMEAMTYGNPVITTGFSGNTDFTNDSNAYLIPAFQTPVTGMSWYVPWYNGTMWWGEPALNSLAQEMRKVFNDRQGAKEQGLRGRQSILEKFNTETSAKQFTDAINDLISKR